MIKAVSDFISSVKQIKTADAKSDNVFEGRNYGIYQACIAIQRASGQNVISFNEQMTSDEDEDIKPVSGVTFRKNIPETSLNRKPYADNGITDSAVDELTDILKNTPINIVFKSLKDTAFTIIENTLPVYFDFLGYCLLVEDSSEGCGTLYMTYDDIYEKFSIHYNPEFCVQMSAASLMANFHDFSSKSDSDCEKELATTVAYLFSHEVGHVLNFHMQNQNSRVAKVDGHAVNLLGDSFINTALSAIYPADGRPRVLPGGVDDNVAYKIRVASNYTDSKTIIQEASDMFHIPYDLGTSLKLDSEEEITVHVRTSLGAMTKYFGGNSNNYIIGVNNFIDKISTVVKSIDSGNNDTKDQQGQQGNQGGQQGNQGGQQGNQGGQQGNQGGQQGDSGSNGGSGDGKNGNKKPSDGEFVDDSRVKGSKGKSGKGGGKEEDGDPNQSGGVQGDEQGQDGNQQGQGGQDGNQQDDQDGQQGQQGNQGKSSNKAGNGPSQHGRGIQGILDRIKQGQQQSKANESSLDSDEANRKVDETTKMSASKTNRNNRIDKSQDGNLTTGDLKALGLGSVAKDLGSVSSWRAKLRDLIKNGLGSQEYYDREAPSARIEGQLGRDIDENIPKRILIMMDTSGSMEIQLFKRCLVELSSFVTALRLRDIKVTVIYWNTESAKKEFRNTKDLVKNVSSGWLSAGQGGGTDLNCAFGFANQTHRKYDIALLCTDACFSLDNLSAESLHFYRTHRNRLIYLFTEKSGSTENFKKLDPNAEKKTIYTNKAL